MLSSYIVICLYCLFNKKKYIYINLVKSLKLIYKVKTIEEKYLKDVRLFKKNVEFVKLRDKLTNSLISWRVTLERGFPWPFFF